MIDFPVHKSQAVTPAIAEALGLSVAWGALVTEASGPAAEAGIVPEDVISSINGQRIKDNFDLARRLDMLPPGTTVHVGLVHEGAVTTIAVELGQTPPSLQPETATVIELPASDSSALDLGLALAPTSAFATADAGEKNGLVVLAIEPDRLGADLGIDPGDIIPRCRWKADADARRIPGRAARCARGWPPVNADAR